MKVLEMCKLEEKHTIKFYEEIESGETIIMQEYKTSNYQKFRDMYFFIENDKNYKSNLIFEIENLLKLGYEVVTYDLEFNEMLKSTDNSEVRLDLESLS